MKLKCLCVIVLFVCLMATSHVFATNSWIGPSGSWGTTSLWGSGHTPIDADGDIKICKTGVTSCTLDVDAGTLETGKIALGGSSSYSIVFNIVSGGSVAIGKEFKVGDAGAGGQGGYGKAVQTGGSIVLNTSTNTGKLEIGYKAGGSGLYTISGGSISGTGGMYVGTAGGGSGAASGSTGVFTVQGNGSSISVGNLYVGASDATETYTGTGTLAFEIQSGAVTAIQAGNVYIDPTNTSASITNLLVSITSGTPVGNILLVNNTGGNAVFGKFDTLNGGSAAEGASVILGGNTYTLTYTGGTGGNDIMLLIPEPATIALLCLGLLAIRRNKK